MVSESSTTRISSDCFSGACRLFLASEHEAKKTIAEAFDNFRGVQDETDRAVFEQDAAGNVRVAIRRGQHFDDGVALRQKRVDGDRRTTLPYA